MKTYNQFLETPFSEEVKPEPPEEEQDNQIASKQKRQMQIKKQVLLKKMQAVRAGAGADIVASHTPDGELVEGDVHSGQGEKIQKRTKKWMDKKGMKGAPGLDAMKARTAEHKAKRGVKEEVIDERTLSSYIPSDRQGEASAANREYVKAQLKKKEDQSTKNRGDLSKRDAGKMAKERLRTKKIMSMGEAEDKAFNFVRNKLKAKYGDGVMTTGEKMKPPTAAQKKAAAAHREKIAKQQAAEFKKDPSQGRYPKG